MPAQYRLMVVIGIILVSMVFGVGSVEADLCSDLALQPYGGATITSAAFVPASSTNPGYCRVLATAGKQTDIEVRLPENWQGRYLHIGGGGFDGAIPDLNVYARELEQGYAIAASNGGHRGEIVDPTFGLDPTLAQDYAHVALGTTVRVAKAVIAVYYGERPRYSYWFGCSNGGRNAFNAAAKYSHEYDGVIAAAPTLNLSGLIAGWMQMVPGSILTPEKIATIDAATLAACDGLDGLKDGIISAPDLCSIDAALIPGLTPAEIAVVDAIRSDTTLSDGTLVYSKNGYGPLIWAPVAGILGIGHIQYIVYRDPSWDPSSYDIDTDYPKIAKLVEGVHDSSADTEPLVRYLKEGRKMIVWHGTDDTILSHYDTARTFEDLMEAAGGSGRTNAKLYLPAGVNHCGGGPGADTFDMIGAITEWVEKGREPKTLVASKLDSNGEVLFTRPICEYPFFPYYNGKGDPNDAKSFQCKRSRH